jgi:hypothetical protein
MGKKLTSLGFVIALMTLLTIIAFAAGATVSGYLNTMQTSKGDLTSIVVDSQNYVKVADVLRLLNVDYTWNNDTKTVIFNENGNIQRKRS